AALVVAEARAVEVRVLRAQARRGRVGQAAEAEILVRLDDLPRRVGVTAREALEAADGLPAGGPAAADRGRGRHGERLGVTAEAVLAHHLRGAGRRVGGRVPAGVDAHLVVGVVVDRVTDLAV